MSPDPIGPDLKAVLKRLRLDRALWNELVSLRFLDAHAPVAIVGPVGVGKTFLRPRLKPRLGTA